MSQPDAPTAPSTPETSAAALRSRILSRPNKLQEKVVHVAQWDTDVLVIELTGLRRAELLQHAAEGNGKVELKRIYPDMVIASAHHPVTREPLFEAADRDALLDDSGSAIETIATIAGQLSGLDDKAGKSAEGN